MVAFSTVKAGDTYWQKARVKMGNTTMSRTVVYPVKIIEVHDDHVIASWNSNTPKKMYERQITKLFRNKPVVK